MPETVSRAPFESRPCLCVSHHVPKPQRVELHHVYPQAEQRKRHGSVIDHETIPLCDTAHANVHAALYNWMRGRMEFRLGNTYLQGIARDGYRRILGS